MHAIGFEYAQFLAKCLTTRTHVSDDGRNNPAAKERHDRREDGDQDCDDVNGKAANGFVRRVRFKLRVEPEPCEEHAKVKGTEE